MARRLVRANMYNIGGEDTASNRTGKKAGEKGKVVPSDNPGVKARAKRTYREKNGEVGAQNLGSVGTMEGKTTKNTTLRETFPWKRGPGGTRSSKKRVVVLSTES